MTSTGSTVLVLFDSTALSSVVVTFTFKVTCMTARTEWRVSQLIRIIITIDTATYRSFVTAITAWIASVVAGVVAITVMAEAGW